MCTRASQSINIFPINEHYHLLINKFILFKNNLIYQYFIKKNKRIALIKIENYIKYKYIN